LSRRVVFDTTTVVSALVFANHRLSWLLQHWQEGACTPLISSATAAELTRVLGYPKFRLSLEDRRELLAHYVPYCEIVERVTRCPQGCRDEKDQPFLDLAQSGGAELLVSGDRDLQALAGQTTFLIQTPEAYRLRIKEEDR
jgi:putative PIN family toxin of toxin-antitoxin system